MLIVEQLFKYLNVVNLISIDKIYKKKKRKNDLFYN